MRPDATVKKIVIGWLCIAGLVGVLLLKWAMQAIRQGTEHESPTTKRPSRDRRHRGRVPSFPRRNETDSHR